MSRGGAKKKAGVETPADLDEDAALAAAAQALDNFGVSDNRVKAAVAISTWIITRARQSVGRRLVEELIWDLGDSKIQGFVEAVLPKIAESLAEAGFDFSKSFNDLTKEEAIQLFTAGAVGHREAAVRAGEDPNFPFDDPIPFGEG